MKVEAGKTATVIATLPWNKGSPWSSWSEGTLVGRDYPESSPCLQTVWDGPTITADDQAIRVFWSFCGDLWWSKSEDGETFSAPMKLPMPVSTGWIEQNPTCLRDESGRYLLAFRSDREAQHMTRAYICWSRDALNWSRPAMVIDRAVGQFGMIQDDKGRYIWADATDGKVTILSSRDAYQWEKCAELPLDGEAAFVCILQRNDGKYELFAESIRYTSQDKSPERARTRVLRWLSSDRVSWTGPEILTELPSHSDGGHISASHVDGSTFVFYCVYVGVTPMLRMFREKPGGGWDAAPSQDWFMGQHGSMSHHPRWGYMIAWSVPPFMQFPIPHKGPYFLRGKSVDQFFGPK